MQIKKEPKRNYIFIVGSGRCGTTALAKLLGKHQSISYTPELKFFSHAMAGRKNYEPLTSNSLKLFFEKRALEKVLKFNRELEYKRTNILMKFNEALRKGENRGYKNWIYKFIFDFLIDSFQNRASENVVIQTPLNLLYLDLIKELFGCIKIIGMIRDPRNFFASAMKGDRIWTKNDEDVIALWNLSAKHLERLKSTKEYDFILVKQEEFLVKPKYVLKKLSEFLSVDLSHLSNEIEYINSSFPEFSSIEEVLNRYTKKLSKNELTKIEYLCRLYMKKFQYSTSPDLPSSSLKKIKWMLVYEFHYLVLRLEIYLRKIGRLNIYFKAKNKLLQPIGWDELPFFR